jgi:hypothetical protein
MWWYFLSAARGIVLSPAPALQREAANPRGGFSRAEGGSNEAGDRRFRRFGGLPQSFARRITTARRIFFQSRLRRRGVGRSPARALPRDAAWSSCLVYYALTGTVYNSSTVPICRIRIRWGGGYEALRENFFPSKGGRAVFYQRPKLTTFSVHALLGSLLEQPTWGLFALCDSKNARSA